MSFFEYSDCFIWRCDGNSCPKEVIFKPHDFMGCVAELKSRGWSFYRDDDGDWSHYCQRCQHKHQQTNIMDRTFKTVKG
jgi:hypothetical protein